MAVEYYYDNWYEYPEYAEYQGELLKKRLMNEKANYAYLKFRKAMKKRLNDINDS